MKLICKKYLCSHVIVGHYVIQFLFIHQSVWINCKNGLQSRATNAKSHLNTSIIPDHEIILEIKQRKPLTEIRGLKNECCSLRSNRGVNEP
jgi:hypothetical protein